jgi:tetratricopeptide (TPR) repeat protein
LQSQQRHRLKQDRFASATAEAVHWSTEHRNTIILVVSLLIVGLVAYIGYTSYVTLQDQKASLALTKAIRTYEAQVREPDAAVNPDVKSFTSPIERAKAAQAEFLKVANDYSMTPNGKYARYMAGVSAMQAGDNSAAESLLKESANYNKDVAALSKYALANLYERQGKQDEAAKLYRETAQLNAASLPRVTAQLDLAAMYEGKQQNDQAIKVYEEIIKQEQEANKKPASDKAKPGEPQPKTPLEEIASNKIEALKKGGSTKPAQAGPTF